MKKFFAILLALVMVLSLAACSVSNGGEKDDGETTEISLWTYPVGKWGDEETVKEILAAFNEVHPEIKVKVEYLAYGGDGDNKIDSAIEGNQAPDIVFEGPERLVANWGAKGKMVDLADLWTDEVKKDTYPSVEVACKNAEGAYYEYPVCMTAHCMAINKTVFEAADAMKYIDEENHTWTTENFIKAVEAVYKYNGGKDVAALFCNGAGGDQGTRALINNMYSGTFTNPEHTEYTVDTEANVKALETLTNMDGIVINPAMDGGQEADAFAQGLLSMSFCWNAANHTQRMDVIGDNFEVLPMAFPTDDGQPELCGGIWGFGIFNNGDEAKIEAAKTFVKWAADENTVNSVAASGFWPTRQSVEDVYPGDELKAVYGSFMPYMGDYYNVIPGWTEARTAWAEMLQSIATGTPVKDAVATFNTAANAAAGA